MLLLLFGVTDVTPIVSGGGGGAGRRSRSRIAPFPRPIEEDDEEVLLTLFA